MISTARGPGYYSAAVVDVTNPLIRSARPGALSSASRFVLHKPGPVHFGINQTILILIVQIIVSTSIKISGT